MCVGPYVKLGGGRESLRRLFDLGAIVAARTGRRVNFRVRASYFEDVGGLCSQTEAVHLDFVLLK